MKCRLPVDAASTAPPLSEGGELVCISRCSFNKTPASCRKPFQMFAFVINHVFFKVTSFLPPASSSQLAA